MRYSLARVHLGSSRLQPRGSSHERCLTYPKDAMLAQFVIAAPRDRKKGRLQDSKLLLYCSQLEPITQGTINTVTALMTIRKPGLLDVAARASYGCLTEPVV
ncbi:hypothetical protein SMMN14_02709 [Sphaerulina musiva]